MTTTTKPDVDLTHGAFYASDSRSIYKWMRENEPVFRDRNGLAAAATYQAVIDAERQPELFSNAGGIRPDQDAPPMMIAMDDPAHLLRRKLVNAGFTRKRVKDREESIAALCDTLIDAVCERGECDFVWDIAAPLPMAVIGDMLGVLPQEREMFLKWSDDMVSFLSSTTAQKDFQVSMDAFAAYTEYMMRMIADRKKEPTDDLVSVLVHAEVEGNSSPTTRSSPKFSCCSSVATRPPGTRYPGAPRSCCATRISTRAWSTTWHCCRTRSKRCCAGPRPSRTWLGR